MVKVKLSRHLLPDRYWLRYTDDAGVVKQVSLTACANSFKLATNNAYDIGDGLQGVGWRYEEGGSLCYELFCVGHLQLSIPLQPSLMDRLVYLLQGKRADEAYRHKLEAFELALNKGGWKTVENPRVFERSTKNGISEI